MIDARQLRRSCVARVSTLSLYARVWRVIIIQIFTIASARRASSRQCRLPTEIAPSEYLLSASIC